jgi:hypothetical protein
LQCFSDSDLRISSGISHPLSTFYTSGSRKKSVTNYDDYPGTEKASEMENGIEEKGSNHYSYRMNQTIKKRRKAMNHKYLNVDINIQKI